MYMVVLSHLATPLRRYPSAHGVTSVAFSNQQQGSEGSSSSARLARPKWMLLGQEGGGIVRAQVSRVVGGAELSQVSAPWNCAGRAAAL